MKAKTVEMEKRPVSVYFLGDIHEGAANHDEKALDAAIRIIEADKTSIWIGLGDYIDAINHRDPRFNPFEISDKYGVRDLADLPRCQCNSLLAKLAKIKEQCIGIISGNHEDANRKYNSFSPTQYIADGLGVENLGQKAWITLNFGGVKEATFPYRLVVMHGAGGGGMREGYSINKAYDCFRWDIADCHVMGHLHQFATSRSTFNTYKYGVFRKDHSWFGVNGCFLHKAKEGTEGYFEQRPGMDSSIGMLRLDIGINKGSKHKHEIGTHLQEIYLA